MKLLAKIKKCSNLQLDLKLTIFRRFLNFLTPAVVVITISNFMLVKITKRLTVIMRMLKTWKKAKLLAIDRLCLYLRRSANRNTARMSSWLFDIPKSPVSRYLVTWTNLICFVLQKTLIWSSKFQILDAMPETFKTTFPSARYITAQIYFAKDHVHCRSRVLSIPTISIVWLITYNSTFGLLEIASSGAITFINELYKGSISDKAIVKRSDILNENFTDDNDSIMADRGFIIKMN